MGSLVFSEANMINGNIFKYEGRLNSQANKYIEGGSILVTYFSQNENSSTVDRGLRDIDKLFGAKSPLRYNRINNLPLYQFGSANPENTEENQIEDINVDGECQIVPRTIVPQQYDFFIVNHVKMTALFMVTAVQHDTMKPDGYYKISYHLHTTSRETIDKLMNHVTEVYYTDLRAIGTSTNPIISENDYLYRGKVEKMVNNMIDAYCAMFYNDRHNCFLFHEPESGLDWFDLCGNEFIAKYSIMNRYNSAKVIVLNNKLRDPQFPIYYNNSVYNWLELGAPERMIQRFFFMLTEADCYPISSFAQWGDGDVQVMQPLAVSQAKINFQQYSFFDDSQLSAFMDPVTIPEGSEYDKLIWKYIHVSNDLDIHDVSLFTGDALMSSIKKIDTFLYTPIVIYIIRQILEMD